MVHERSILVTLVALVDLIPMRLRQDVAADPSSTQIACS